MFSDLFGADGIGCAGGGVTALTDLFFLRRKKLRFCFLVPSLEVPPEFDVFFFSLFSNSAAFFSASVNPKPPDATSSRTSRNRVCKASLAMTSTGEIEMSSSLRDSIARSNGDREKFSKLGAGPIDAGSVNTSRCTPLVGSLMESGNFPPSTNPKATRCNSSHGSDSPIASIVSLLLSDCIKSKNSSCERSGARGSNLSEIDESAPKVTFCTQPSTSLRTFATSDRGMFCKAAANSLKKNRMPSRIPILVPLDLIFDFNGRIANEPC